MRGRIALVLILVLLTPAPGQATEAVDLSESRGIVGGLVIDLGLGEQDTSVSAQAEDLPRVVEVYTATWCANCVGAEHALDEAIEGENAVVLSHHRSIGEVEDPFGTQDGDWRWEDLYGSASQEVTGLMRAAPTMVFDGCRVKVGTSPSGDSLQTDYEELLALPMPDSGAESSTLTWTGNNNSGTVGWGFSFAPAETTSWVHRLMVVEAVANFPEGSNGLEDYTTVVREVVTLNGDDGSMALELPAAWDGDDLYLVLLHEWTTVAEEADGGILGALPGLGMLTLLPILAALLPSRRER